MQIVADRPQGVKAGLPTVEQDELRMLGIKRLLQSFASPRRIKSAQALQALLHGRDAQFQHVFEIDDGNITVRDALGKCRSAGHSCPLHSPDSKSSIQAGGSVGEGCRKAYGGERSASAQ